MELLRFFIVGALSFGCNFAIIVYLTDVVGLNYLVSIVVCFSTTTFVSFWLNRLWTFRKIYGSPTRDLGRYLTTTLVQMMISVGLCGICVEIFHWPYKLAVIILSGVLVPVNFLLHRRWSFDLGWGVRTCRDATGRDAVVPRHCIGSPVEAASKSGAIMTRREIDARFL